MLDAGLKATLLMGGAGPLGPGRSGSEGLIISLSSFYLLACFSVFDICWSASILGSSADTLIGWAEHLHALYMEIGG